MADTIYVVHYYYDPQHAEDLAQLRPDHRKFLRSLFDAGQLLASGPYSDHEALIVLRTASAESALALLTEDPLYRAGGIIAKRTATQWQPVIGPWA